MKRRAVGRKREVLVADLQWHFAVDIVTPYVVRIWTPTGSGTGFLVSASKTTPLCAVATAAHVVDQAHYWEQPIRVEHQQSAKTLLLRPSDRAITLQPERDTAAIVFERGEIAPPAGGLPLAPKDKHFKPGVEIGWLGYPAIPRASLCFFSGRVSAWLDSELAYLVDGVAINGVSGGPAFVIQCMLAGVVSAYIPNRATGESLPGLALLRNVDQLHDLVQGVKNLDEARAAQTPPGAVPPAATSEPDGAAKTSRTSA